MKRDLIFVIFVAAVIFGCAGVFLSLVSAAANASVFNVTDPDRGLYRMHAPLVKGES